MSKQVIDLTEDSDTEIDHYNVNYILSVDRVPSPIRWSPVFIDVTVCESQIILEKRKVSEAVDMTPPFKKIY